MFNDLEAKKVSLPHFKLSLLLAVYKHKFKMVVLSEKKKVDR